ncbi:UTP--glucose-1-phosphate uridylyltransferase GalU [Candidatus Dependentiae bacterium]|nr:UTP--glucose-1-phosphate uridylyltransferase GalU [Candidatus Dependentiae bacterium]
MKIKAVIPAAGFGTRFLPTTKAVPKELLPIVDKPAIQYIVEEGLLSGIKDFVIITGKNKKAIEDHFDNYQELQSNLKSKNKENLIESISKIIEKANFLFVRQREQLGLGHAIQTARPAFSDEHLAIFLPDDIFTGKVPGMAQLIKIATQEKCNVVAVQEVPKEEVNRYGIIDIRRQFSPNLFQVRDLVEKPPVNAAPSNLAIVGRYVLSSNIFESLEDLQFGSGGEIQLTDGIQNLLLNGEKVFAYKIQGQRYDAGTILGWLKTNIEFALKHPEYSNIILEHLSKLDREFLVMQGKAESLSKKQVKINI